MTYSEDLNDSNGSVTDHTRLGRKIIFSSESDEVDRDGSTHSFEIRVPSLIDESFDETVNPAEVKIEEEDWLFDPAEAKRQLQILMGNQGAGPSNQRAKRKGKAKKKRVDPPC